MGLWRGEDTTDTLALWVTHVPSAHCPPHARCTGEVMPCLQFSLLPPPYNLCSCPPTAQSLLGISKLHPSHPYTFHTFTTSLVAHPTLVPFVMLSLCCLLVALVALVLPATLVQSTTPEQIHLSLGQSQNDWWCSWVTFDSTPGSYVAYGTEPSQLKQKAAATDVLFVDEGKAQKKRYMHEAHMPALEPGTVYYYAIYLNGSAATAATELFNFSTITTTAGYTTPLRIAMYGDYGLLNDRSHDRLQAESLAGNLDLIIHAGDFAYNLDDENGDRGDKFMNAQQTFLAHTPMQVCAGNHEDAYNFSHYRARFHMPGTESGSSTNLYSSFNVGPVHFVSIDTELYFYDHYYDNSHILRQYKWLINDLETANKNRAAQPWLVVYGHRPMYATQTHRCTAHTITVICVHTATSLTSFSLSHSSYDLVYVNRYCTNDIDDDPAICTADTSALRDGVSFPHGGYRAGPLEELLWQYKVDFYFSGHMHSYERLYPTYREQVISREYAPLKGPLHIIAGAAGCQEYLDEYDKGRYDWSAVTSDSYGYGKFIVYNGTHAEWQQILDEDGSVLDHIAIVRTDEPYKLPERRAGVHTHLPGGRRHSKRQ